MKIGEVDRTQYWYTLSDGTVISFHVAYLNEERTASILFVSDNETWPSVTLENMGIADYTFIRNATLDEVESFMSEMKLTLKGEEEE